MLEMLTCVSTARSMRRFLSSKGIMLISDMLFKRIVPATRIYIVAKSLPPFVIGEISPYPTEKRYKSES